jgi:membrane-bound serine protease (ClpP class)
MKKAIISLYSRLKIQDSRPQWAYALMGLWAHKLIGLLAYRPALCLVYLVLCLLVCGTAASSRYQVDLIEFDDFVINPVSARFFTKAISRAYEDGAECLIVRLDTPGGLQKSMESMYKATLNSPVPIVVYVAPKGAQATSAGVFIALSAHITAMAPDTKIGSAHPIAIGGMEMDEDVKNKIVEHTVGEIKKIAEGRGRNVEWAEKAVRESISSTWTEALDQNVIDLIANDLDELLEKIDGREVVTESGERVLHTKDAEIRTVKMNFRDRLLNIISDPNIAYIFLILGFYGLFFELSNPGSIFPGVVGGICIILAFFAFQTLPVNYAGVLLILLAIVLFILEIKITSYGLLSIGGIVSMLMGSMMLIDSTEPFAYIFKISWQVILPAVLVTAAFFIIAMVFVIRTHRKKAVTGKEGLIGAIGVCETEINPEGKIFLHGEFWNSISEEVIQPKEKVRVVGADGLTLKVEKVDLRRKI